MRWSVKAKHDTGQKDCGGEGMREGKKERKKKALGKVGGKQWKVKRRGSFRGT